MLNKEEFLLEEKDCANMLGMNLEEYHKYLKDTKVSTKESNHDERKYDNSILTKLGLSSSDLKSIMI